MVGHVRERLFALLFTMGMAILMLLASLLGLNGELMPALMAIAVLVGSYYFRPRGKDGTSESN